MIFCKLDESDSCKYSRDTQEEHKPQNGVYGNSTATRLSEQYDVSKNTIQRDFKNATAIDAIGETSPEAKRMIIAGEAKVSKKRLEEIAAMPQEEVTEIALSIEDGTFGKKGASADAPQQPATPIDAALASVNPLDSAIAKMSALLQTTLPGITRKADKTKLQAKLRSSIDTLESLYSRI